MTACSAAARKRSWLRNAIDLTAIVAVAAAIHLVLQALTRRGVVSNYHLKIVRDIGINVVMAASLNLVNGVAGQFSIGHAGFMAVGAYTAASVTLAAQSALKASGGGSAAMIIAFLVAHVMAGLAASVAGVLVGLPSLRLRGDYLAIVTLGFGEIIRSIVVNVPALGGALGMRGMPQMSSVFAVWLVVGVSVVALHRIARSDFGRALLAIREDEVAASAMGIDTTAKKVGAFTIAAFFAGVGGGLFAHANYVVDPSTFKFDLSFQFVVMVILGGMGSLSGSIIAAIVLTVLLELLRNTILAGQLHDIGLHRLAEWVSTHDLRISIYALLLILLMILRPHGLLGLHEIWQTRWWRAIARRVRPSSANAAGDSGGAA